MARVWANSRWILCKLTKAQVGIIFCSESRISCFNFVNFGSATHNTKAPLFNM
jgi:hypothetical protein